MVCTGVAVQKPRPCSECRRWFRPHPRVGARQRTCGDAACRQTRHQRADRQWHERHPDYDRARRWQAALDLARAAESISPPKQPPLPGVPWDLVQDAMKLEGRVILAGVAGVLVRHAQDEMRRQLLGFTPQSGGLPPSAPPRRDGGEPGPLAA
jgi:hypothetical protein